MVADQDLAAGYISCCLIHRHQFLRSRKSIAFFWERELEDTVHSKKLLQIFSLSMAVFFPTARQWLSRFQLIHSARLSSPITILTREMVQFLTLSKLH